LISENPLVFVDTTNNTDFHFMANQLMGHPNGLLTTEDALYLSDLNYRGAFSGTSPAGVAADREGVIYQITAVPEPWTIALVAMAACVMILRRLFRRL
jgi:hypothetical protein